MIEADIRTALLGSSAVMSIVEERIAALTMPEGESAPYVVYQLVAGNREGSMISGGCLRNGRFQLSCFSNDYLQAKALAEAVQNAIEDYEGFDSVFISDRDLQDPTTKLYYVVLEYSIWQDT